MTEYLVRNADCADVPRVAEMMAEASSWLTSQGSDQWQYPPPVNVIERDVEARTLYVVLREGEVIAAATIDRNADPDFWEAGDRPEDALYVHKMAIDRAWAGRKLGASLLDLAGVLAEEAGLPWVRLDAWKTNERLHRYYQEEGFDLVRLVDLEHRQSGALFQRKATARSSGITLVREGC
ncbi:GNAT family N-acetyltransferase [Nocardiopsis sp. CNT-189]|uniref:GNAT family N-acetyltransferase n=1 Tax=Nocardiopsis oceanisediminis TaxID=2816862 RepID=UPI003B2A0464